MFLFSLISAMIIIPVSLVYSSSPLLTNIQEEMFQNSLSTNMYLNSFPGYSYKIFNSPGQGNFYIDNDYIYGCRQCDTIKNCIIRHVAWEPESDQIIVKYTKPNTLVLDIGAHIGTHTIPMSKAVGEYGVVIAFEPQKKIYRELCMNLQLNNIKNVRAVNCALGNKSQTVTMTEPLMWNEGGRFIGVGNEKVSMKILDSFGFKNVSFIKMDVENFEDIVLEGAVTTIQDNKPVILIEIQGNEEQLVASGTDRVAKTKAVIQQLEKLGYKVENIKGYDYLALPIEKS